jgi:eukaryotic-like serine/threonine-protein kinase
MPRTNPSGSLRGGTQRRAVASPRTARPAERLRWDTVSFTDVTVPGRDATTLAGDGSEGMFVDVPRGTSIDRYIVTGKLGEGGMGVVYSAYDPELDRRLAIKLLRVGLGSSGRNDSADSGDGGRIRLMREAQAMARLRHPNVLTVHDVGTWQDQLFVAMEFVEGGTLSGWLQQRRPKWRDTLRILVKAGRGLAAAHDKGLLHRDFKPDNVLISNAGEVFVTDFGLARPMGGFVDEGEAPSVAHGVLDTPLTQTGALMGTPAYMSPEQFRGLRASPASDQFSFCVTAFVALFGCRPFPGASLQELMASVSSGRRQEPRDRKGVPKWIERAVVRGLAVAPQERWPSMHALLEHLEIDPWVTRRRVFATMGVAAGAAAITGIALGLSDDPPAMGATVPSAPGATSTADPCPPPVSALSGVWDDRRREALARRFAESGLPYAQTVHDRVRETLDSYARSWLDGQLRACRATRVDRVQTEAVYVLQLSCFERRRSQLAELVGILDAADTDMITRALDIADRNLADIAGCEAVETLVREAEREHDPDHRSQMTQLETTLDRTAAWIAGGRHDEAETSAIEAHNAARALALPRQEAVALSLLGELSEARGDFAKARQFYEQTLDACARGKDDRLAAKTWTRLVYVVGNELGAPTEALAMESPATLALVRSGDEPQLRANLYTNLGSVYNLLGRHEDAARYHRDAIELRTRVFGADDHRVFDGLSNLANVRFAQGRLDEAEQLHIRVLEHRRARLGAEHPDVATSHNNLGGVLYTLDQFGEAIEHLERAVNIRERTLTADHPTLLGSYSNLASAYQMTGRYADSEQLLRRTIEAIERRHGKTSPELGTPLNNLANTLERMGRLDEAIAAHRRALQIRTEHHGGSHRVVAQSLAGLASALAANERADEATEALDRAIAVYEGTTGLDTPEAALALEHRAQLHHDAGEFDAAEPLYRRAIDVRSATGSNPGELAVNRFNLAKVLRDKGELADAMVQATLALQSLERLELYPDRQRDIRAWLDER